MKKCRDCNLEAPLEEFPRHVSGYFYPYCIDCKRAKQREYARKYNEANRDLVNSRAKDYRDSHKTDLEYIERRREHGRKQREKDREANREYMREYKRKNRERMTHHEATRRARNNSADGYFSFEEWVELCKSFGNICLRCKQGKPLTIDHIKPLAQGGSNWIQNIQPLCKECNSVKGNKEEDYRMG